MATISSFMLATSISVVYLLFRFIEMRFILKKNEPFRSLLKDAILVYLSTLLGHYVLTVSSPIKGIIQGTAAFTNDPDF